VKLMIGVLLLIVIVVAVNAVLATNQKPKLAVLQGGLAGIGPRAGKAAGI